ncbi:protein phosphatase CheZ [Pusillimonas sp. CC-YST705]|uniref:Protein phosphatase CheZ n=1 Tax=Mesopusillimonas faecipullorum TaxID=2755040 RepID=A0ABS8C9V4_9BURK|nr:protein phosphatase CheZ [Mesopusillimonas faecipullorum]MCB5362806.1 protein phosphatase CheZ [Mesopusillimonas faecipullorum]
MEHSAALESENTRPVAAEPTEHLLNRIGQLTRMLRESMRELGLDQAIKEAAEAIPDARDRLGYVARMTEQAANRVLNAAEDIQPLQTDIQRDARSLASRWQSMPSGDADLAADTRVFLADVDTKTQRTQENLLDIIMAQDFQDLTGQVIMRMLGVVDAIEKELVQVLIENVPAEKREDTESLINGPQTRTEGRPDIVTNQDQVDDLLSSLGF